MEMQDRLRLYRKELNVSQQQLANLINTSQSKIRNIETGRQKISNEDAKKVCNLHPRFNLNWLLFNEGEPFLKENENYSELPGQVKIITCIDNSIVLPYFPSAQMIEWGKEAIKMDKSLMKFSLNSENATGIDFVILYTQNNMKKELIGENAKLLFRSQSIYDNQGVYLIRHNSENKIKTLQIKNDKYVIIDDDITEMSAIKDIKIGGKLVRTINERQ